MKNLLILFFTTLSICAQAQRNSDPEFSKKTIGIAFGLPYLNHMNLNIERYKSINKFGFYGLSAGVYYKLNIQNGVLINYEFIAAEDNPIGTPYKKEGHYQTQNAQYYNLIITHEFNSLSFGLGFFYSIKTWKEGERINNGKAGNSNGLVSSSGGLIFISFFELNKKTKIGIIYRNHGISPYEHTMSIALKSDIPLLHW